MPGTIEWTKGWLQNTYEAVCTSHPEVVELIEDALNRDTMIPYRRREFEADAMVRQLALQAATSEPPQFLQNLLHRACSSPVQHQRVDWGAVMPPPKAERAAACNAARTVHILADRPAVDTLVSELSDLLLSVSPLPFTNADIGKALCIQGNVLKINGEPRLVHLGDPSWDPSLDLTTIKAVEEKYEGKVQLEDGRELENATLRFATSIDTASHVLVLLTGGLLQQGSAIEAELSNAVKHKRKHKLAFVYSTEHGWDFPKFYAQPGSEAKAAIANHEALVFRSKAAFSNADVGKSVSITGDKVLVDGMVRNVNWGDTQHRSMDGWIKSVDPKYKGKVELEDGQEFENGAKGQDYEKRAMALELLRRMPPTSLAPDISCLRHTSSL